MDIASKIAFMGRSLYVASTVGMVAFAASTVAGCGAATNVSVQQSSWTTVWRDDFTGRKGLLPSSSRWIIDLGHGYPGGPDNWGTGEVESYTKQRENLGLNGTGYLLITPRKDTRGNWTSARIETKRTDFKAPAGGVLQVQARIRVPRITGSKAEGYWPAFWMLGAPFRGNYWNWPKIGEFDIMENVNGLNKVWGVLHCGTTPGGPCNEPSGLGEDRPCPSATCQTAFHVYRFEWDRSASPNELRWYVDGTLYHRVSQATVGSAAWTNMTSHRGYFILLNVAMGGAFPDAIARKTTPTSNTASGYSMTVDFVSVATRK